MKKFKNYFLLGLLTICMGFAFTACGDDDDDPEYESSAIVGSWNLTAYEGWEKENGTLSWSGNSLNDSDIQKIDFKADGSALIYVEGFSFPVTYKVQGNQLIVNEPDNGPAKATILTLNATTLVLEAHEFDTEDGDSYEDYEKMTFTRAN